MDRHNLYMFRCDKKLTQEEIGAECGVSRSTYANIEQGRRDGSMKFWDAFQERFNLSDDELRKLRKRESNDEQKSNSKAC